MAAYEFRPYSFMMMFSTLTIYFYIKRTKEHHQIKWHIFYSFAMLGLGMSHYFGMVACAEFFLSDVYLLFKRRISWKTCADYLFPGAICLGWVIAVFAVDTGRISGLVSWQSKPSFANIRNLLYVLSGNIEISYWILIFGISLSISGLILWNKAEFKFDYFYQAVLTCMIVGTVATLAFYGMVINPDFTMWISRYFLFLVPNACVLMGNAAVCVLEKGNNNLFQRAICICIWIIFSLSCFASISQLKSSEPYRESANWIYQQINYIFNEKTVIISRDGVSATKGWQEYYISRKGLRDPLNVYANNISKENLLKHDRVYVQYCRAAIGQNLTSVLNEYYNLESDQKDIKVRVYIRK